MAVGPLVGELDPQTWVGSVLYTVGYQFENCLNWVSSGRFCIPGLGVTATIFKWLAVVAWPRLIKGRGVSVKDTHFDTQSESSVPSIL